MLNCYGIIELRGVHVGQFIVKNEGRSGRFYVIFRSSWPATNFKAILIQRDITLSYPMKQVTSLRNKGKGNSQ